MKKILILASLVIASAVWAENAPDPMNPNDLVNPTSVIVDGPGIKVGEGTIIRPTVGLETGVVTNVFFEDTNATAAGLLRVLLEISTGTLPPARLGIHNAAATNPTEQMAEAGMVQFLATAYASWDQYLSTNDFVQAQGGLGGGALFKGVVNPRKPISFGFLEHFDRAIRATNFESGNRTNRDVNRLSLQLNLRPRERNLGGYLYWTNLIDHFEDENQQFANRFQNTFGGRAEYQWLPLTRLYLESSIGVFTGLGDSSTKVNAFPLRVFTGIQTALTLNFTMTAQLGYTNGFYAEGSNYSTVTGGVQAGYRYSPFGRVTAMYMYDHQDSINANFYRDHLLNFNIDHQFVPFAVNLGAELRFRHYGSTLVMGVDGSTSRDDVLGAVNVGARYMFRNWIAAVASYQFAALQTDFRYDAGGGFIDNPSFLRHQLLTGVRVAY
ncbi:MAG: hypothetical protein KIT31_00660 [Deltaproteobacteria bacterium]|nr:hypothetical protein [Deltaproteobacteria bacterium]